MEPTRYYKRVWKFNHGWIVVLEEVKK